MEKEKDSLNETEEDKDDQIQDAGEDTRVEVEIVGNKTSLEDAAETNKDNQVVESDTAAEEPPAKEEATREEPPEPESERYLRLAAEFDNYRKRTSREFGEIIKTANTRLLRELIEIKDNFERALDEKTAPENHDSYRKGVELIYNQLAELLKKENIEPIESIGKPFDPLYHEAMMQQESEKYEEGIVCQELQRGYLLGDRVLRHARVIVSGGRKAKDGPDKDN